MSKQYNHLSLEEREKIAILKASGRSSREIGRLLGRDHRTVGRELKRNAPPVHQGYYVPHRAHVRAQKRKEEASSRGKLKNEEIRCFVVDKLKLGWSPEQIAGRMRQEKQTVTVSHESIYQYIYEETPELIGYLARRHVKRWRKRQSRKHRKSHIPNRVSLEARPAAANKRKEFGHWEADSMANKMSRAALNVLVERKSRSTRVTKLDRNTARLTSAAVNRRLAQYHQKARVSLTYDNGPENAEHERVNAVLGTKSYFCAPFHSWEKATVENTIGLIRRFIPKKMNIAKVTKQDVRFIEERLNNRPRKCLGFKTPSEVFKTLNGALPN